MKSRVYQFALLIFTLLLGFLCFYQMIEKTVKVFPTSYIIALSVFALLYILTAILIMKFQPYANHTILSCVLLLTMIGITIITRIDYTNKTQIGLRQLIWCCIALVISDIIICTLKDYRIFRRFSYVSMFVGLALLLSPMIPGLGRELGGARIWIGMGSYTLQPGEFAKIFLAIFFAAYLFEHRDQLAVGGKRIMKFQLPRIQDMGPIIIVWLASMGVLIVQRDLGTSLMFFAMFISMLYVATGRKEWIAIGVIAFILGSVASAEIFSHVHYRVEAWLNPFDNKIYQRTYGGSMQLVSGLFGLAAGGLVGTGLGQGHPALTPLANSDFVYSSIGEELGLVGLLAILLIFIIIISSGLITAMKIKDGFGKLLCSGLVFTMAFQVFTVVGGITRVIPLTGLTLPYIAAGGSSLVANYVLATLLIIISNSANTPEPKVSTDTFKYDALA
ncbi:MAG: FtsW/RodA/SpoVE family cell cycle protein, partial [Bifidobacteriaceae bacterium]|nr:FtsW/RodA/SpoVE family cell cycle protein [Bifidobacteriaceae bacterium]